METKIIQITAGRGPLECCRVVAKVLDKIIKDLKNEKITYDVISTSKTNINGAYYSATIKICSNDINKLVTKWNGTIKWIAQSPYRKYHKRKNWYIGIQFFDIPKSCQWNDRDVKYETCRASGPGGQNVNKVESAVRAIHIPTGISVLVMDSRSQHQNKKISRERLQEKLELNFMEEMISNQQNQWQEHNELERGNELLVFEESL